MTGTPLVFANLDTRHFTFTAFAKTKHEAERLMAQAWKIHAKATGAENWNEFSGGVQYFSVALGEAYRDGDRLVPPMENK